jgi:hypothetical protein
VCHLGWLCWIGDIPPIVNQMNIRKNITCCVSSPICHLLMILIGSLAVIELAHTHAHYTMDRDVDSYVRKFCKKNLEECERIISDFD